MDGRIKAAARAMSVICMIKRHLKNLEEEDILRLYKSYMRPHIEYCIHAWSPYRVKDIQCRENVQRSATKLVTGLKRNHEQTTPSRANYTGTAKKERRHGRTVGHLSILS